VLERAVILAGEGEIQIQHLPVALEPERKRSSLESQTADELRLPFGALMKDVEEAYIRLTLHHTNGNRRRAAETSGDALKPANEGQLKTGQWKQAGQS
jgi:DNA-binding NtrC family response regulator